MSEPAIRVRDLGKKFHIGAVRRERYATLRDRIARAASAPARRAWEAPQGPGDGGGGAG